MAVASFQPAAVVYREEQNFDWRVYAIVTLAEAFVGITLIWFYQQGHLPVPNRSPGDFLLGLVAVMMLTLPLLILIGFLRMTTEVTPTEIRVWFGWIPTYRRFYPVDLVSRLEIVSYRPVVDYGGWGIRTGRDGERVLNARGNRGVRLELTDGTRLLIGSQRPEDLAMAIEQALRPGG